MIKRTIMRNYNECKLCGEYHFSDTACLPPYTVFEPDYSGDDGIIVRANNHFDAALKYAEYRNDHGENFLLDDNTIDVEIEKDGVRKKYKLSA